MHKLFKQTFQTIVFAFLIFINTNCSNSNKKNNLETKVPIIRIDGHWYNVVSKNMGGFEISATSRLSIGRSGSSNYYTVSTTIVDQMYGGKPKTESSSGKLDEIIEDGKWKFITGDYGERGGYIVIPSDYWKNNSPSEITIQFTSGRGNTMTFER
jgi:hypothetical protein